MRTSRINRPLIAITMGDPSGIGSEVTVKAMANREISRFADFFVIGDKICLEKMAKKLKISMPIPTLDMSNVDRRGFSYGISRAGYGKASMEYIDKALELLRFKKIDALVTAPVNKSSINSWLSTRTTLRLRLRQASHAPRLSAEALAKAEAAIFEGHTEYLAEKSGAKDFCMMFVGEKLKIALVTRHIPLKDVSRKLSRENIAGVICLADNFLRKNFRIARPKIGVAGLNPHSGENGLFGDEEARVIIPAVRKALKRGARASGPVAPDVIFSDAFKGKFDAVVSLYHDQALIPFKMLYFRDGVNVTAGLPFIRTSPDHGTAFDIAGKGLADPSSMIESMKLAEKLIRLQRSN